MSIKRLVETNVWNEQTGQWEQPYQKTAAQIVETSDGSNVQEKLDEIPGKIADAKNEAVSEIRGGAADAGNTLYKLHGLITALQELVHSDDVDLDTVQEIADYIKANRDDLTLMGTNKLNYADLVNNLSTPGTTEKKALDARQGKVLKDFIDALKTDVTALQTQAQDLATTEQLNDGIAQAVSEAKLVLSETAPLNPVDGQVWLKSVGSITV